MRLICHEILILRSQIAEWLIQAQEPDSPEFEFLNLYNQLFYQ